MAVYVLVHGAWGGSWCWKGIRRALQARGHEAFTPTLSGVGERSHLLSKQVNLSTHIADVVNLFRWEDLSDVVLCGHSYGGCVVTGAADQIADRIRALVYVDAFVPDNGQSLHDTLPADQRDAQVQGAIATGDGWRVSPIPAEIFNVNARDRAWVNEQRTPQSLATFQQPLRLTGAIDRIKNVTYVLATGWEHSPFPQFYEKAKAKGWKTLTMACGHDVMLDKRDELLDVLLAVPGQPQAS
ncbi:MAG TPA: alpha/beta hydrolase [Terriglobales bacterium]|nr:alpha/beta hydrolase [Terriglobales bacterium]